MNSNFRITIDLDSLGDEMAETEQLLRQGLDIAGYDGYLIKIEEIKNENIQGPDDNQNK